VTIFVDFNGVMLLFNYRLLPKSGTIKKLGVELTEMLGRCFSTFLPSGGGMRFIVKVEWQEEDGTIAGADLGQIDSNALQSASDVGLKLSDAKPILTQLQNIITKVAYRVRRRLSAEHQ
jgi:hypothetical protein